MEIRISFGNILRGTRNKSISSYIVGRAFSALSAAMVFLFCLSLTSEKSIAQEFSKRSAGPINQTQHDGAYGGPVPRFAHGRISHPKSTGINQLDTIISVAGAAQAVGWDAAYVTNEDGSCTVVDLGEYDITTQPKLGYLTTGTGTTTYLGWADCPAGPYTVNILYFTALSAVVIGDRHDDSFSYTWSGCYDGSCESFDNTLYDEIATLNAPSSVWWFGGVNPGSKTYPISVQLDVNIGQGTLLYDGPYNWHLITGSDVVKFTWPYGKDPISAVYNAVQTIAAAPPNSPNDVSIELGMIVNDVFGNHVDMRTPAISLSVLEPYKNVKLPVSVTEDFCEAATPYGYSCFIHYGTQDQNGKMMPDGDLPANERFLSAPVAYQQNNWVPALACGGEPCTSINPAAWNDNIIMAGYPGATPVSNCYATTCIPQPTQPTNGVIPRSGVEVRYWRGEWRLGSATIGIGIRVQTNNWNEFVDHAQHDNIISPAPD